MVEDEEIPDTSGTTRAGAEPGPEATEPEGSRTVAPGDEAVPTGEEGMQASNVETLNVHAHGDDEAGEYYFTVDEYDADGRDPDLVLEPGQTYRVILTNEGPDGRHNLRLGPPLDEATEAIEPGESTEITFTADEDTPAEYWCDAHEERDMGGDILLEDPWEDQAVLEKDAPGVTVDAGGPT